MNRDDIARMARKSGCGWAQNGTEPVLMGKKQLTQFYNLIGTAEREACAQVADKWIGCDELADAIRARGKISKEE